MNNKGNIKSYIAVSFILLMSLVLVFYMLNSAKKEQKAKPITSSNIISNKKDKTDDVKIETSDKGENTVNDDIKLEVYNFETTLGTISDRLNIFGDYKEMTIYNGVKFNFNCVVYDEESFTCIEGSALMNVDDALIPLFTYSNPTDNYFLRSDNYYIILNDDFIILSYSVIGVSSGELRIYDRKGNLLKQVNNVVLGFKKNGEIKNNIYPSINNNALYFNTCENNNVVNNSIDFNNINNVLRNKVINGVSCY